MKLIHSTQLQQRHPAQQAELVFQNLGMHIVTYSPQPFADALLKNADFKCNLLAESGQIQPGQVRRTGLTFRQSGAANKSPYFDTSRINLHGKKWQKNLRDIKSLN